MTTTSSTTSTTANSNIISSLGAGSGIDTKALAQSLVDAERIPRKEVIDNKISKSEAKISGYAAIAFGASTLKDAFSALNDTSDFNSLAIRNSNASAFGVTTSSSAEIGDYEITVTSLAKPQRSASDGFADSSTDLSASDFTLELYVNGAATPTEIDITAATSSPANIVSAINAADVGVTAQLIDTGDGSATPYKIVLTGSTGSSFDFTMTSNTGAGGTVSGLDFNTATADLLQAATDATLNVNGLTVVRSTNIIDDVITGVTLDLYTTTATAATVNLTRDTTALKEKFTALVTAYNDANSMLNVLANKDSTVEVYGGALFGDSTVRTVRNQMRDMIIGASNTPGTNATYLWQAGINLTSTGELVLDETELDTALSDNFEAIVTMLTGDTNSLSVYSTADAGIAGEAIRNLTTMLDTDGILTEQTNSTTEQIDKYKLELETLETRMQKLLENYQSSFGAMDAMVSQSNSMRKSLTSSFEGMANVYK